MPPRLGHTGSRLGASVQGLERRGDIEQAGRNRRDGVAVKVPERQRMAMGTGRGDGAEDSVALSELDA